MGVPVSQMWTVVSYVLKQRMAGRDRYPLVLMLEPLFRCNLACAGCGKDPVSGPHPEDEPDAGAVLQSGGRMRRADGLHPRRRAADAPARSTRSSKGWSPARSTSTSAPTRCCSRKRLHLFKPSKYLSFSVHVDGQREHHDFSVCKEGGYDTGGRGHSRSGASAASA